MKQWRNVKIRKKEKKIQLKFLSFLVSPFFGKINIRLGERKLEKNKEIIRKANYSVEYFLLNTASFCLQIAINIFLTNFGKSIFYQIKIGMITYSHHFYQQKKSRNNTKKIDHEYSLKIPLLSWRLCKRNWNNI